MQLRLATRSQALREASIHGTDGEADHADRGGGVCWLACEAGDLANLAWLADKTLASEQEIAPSGFAQEQEGEGESSRRMGERGGR